MATDILVLVLTTGGVVGFLLVMYMVWKRCELLEMRNDRLKQSNSFLRNELESVYKINEQLYTEQKNEYFTEKFVESEK